jgi:hypothetical protein
MNFLKLFTILVLIGLTLSVPVEKKSENKANPKKGDYDVTEEPDFSTIINDGEMDLFPFQPCSEDWFYEFKNNHKYDAAYEYWKRYSDYYRRLYNHRYHHDDDKQTQAF